jgi:hypothetical protein
MDFLKFLIEANYDGKITALKTRYPDKATDIDWAKVYLKKADRIVWYLKLLEKYFTEPKSIGNRSLADLQQSLLHYIGQDIPVIQNYQFTTQTPDQVLADLAQKEREHQAKQGDKRPAGRYNTNAGDRELMKFPNGTAWYQLNRAYCEREGASGLHCGNVVGKHKPDQRILSYRGTDHRVILTFILEPDGTLGEMKGIANTKPLEKYHAAIYSLIMQPYIKGISGGGYMPDSNFSVFDLDEKYLENIHKQKSVLISTQAKTTPWEIIQAPDWVKQAYGDDATQQMPALERLLSDPSHGNWTEAIDNDSSMILYAPDDYPNYQRLLLDYLIDEGDQELLLRTRKTYRSNYEFLKQLLEKSPNYIQAVVPTHKNYKDLAFIAVQNHGGALDYVPEPLRTEQMCLAAVQNYGGALRYVPEPLRTEQMCLAAVQNYGGALEYVPVPLRTEQICLAAVQNNGLALGHVPGPLRTEKMCLAAVQNDGWALRYVPRELRNEQMCLAAVKQNGRILEYLPRELRNEQMCLAAVKQNGEALEHVPPELRQWVQDQINKSTEKTTESRELIRIRQLSGLR